VHDVATAYPRRCLLFAFAPRPAQISDSIIRKMNRKPNRASSKYIFSIINFYREINNQRIYVLIILYVNLVSK